MRSPVVIFPHLGIEIENMTSGFSVFGIHIAWYGVIIALGILIAAMLIFNLARRTGQNPDDYIDIAILTVIFGIIGARIYYVIFNWSYYSANLKEIINLRNGGLAIYGGLILGVTCIAVMCKLKKMSFLRVLDTCAPGVVIAQAIGRWGNFVNMEAYGGYTDNVFAMQIKLSEASGVVSKELMDNIVTLSGEHYIQVHPTFLYESFLCIIVFIGVMIFRKKAKYYGEVALWYFGGYALGRFFIEALRTDALHIGNTDIAVSQMLALLVFCASLAILVVMRIYIFKTPDNYDYVHLTVPGWKDLKFEKQSKKKKDDIKDEDVGMTEEKSSDDTKADDEKGQKI